MFPLYLLCACIYFLQAVGEQEVGGRGGVGGVSQPSALLQRTTARTIEVLTSTTINTKAVLNTISDSQWWKDSVSYLRPLHVSSELRPLLRRLKNVEIGRNFFVSLVRGKAWIRSTPDQPIRTQNWSVKAATRSTRSCLTILTSARLVPHFLLPPGGSLFPLVR